MAVQAPAKQSLFDDFDEDDGPLIVKRKNTASKPNQLSSELKKPLSQRLDGQSGRQISDGVFLNGINSYSQKGKVVQSSKASPVKSPLVSPKASTSSTKAATQKSLVEIRRASTSLDGRPKFSSGQNKYVVVKEEKSSIRQSTTSDIHFEDSDSDDDKPLSARLKGNSNQGDKGTGKSTAGDKGPGKRTTGPQLPPVKKKESQDSDDEPLSSKFQVKSNAGTSGSNRSDCDDKKPLSSINKQNGSTVKDERKPLDTSAKRPLDKQKSDVSPVKKQKLSYSSSLMKSKQESVKAESKADDDDHVPISQRIKKSPASTSKASTPKQNIKKSASSSSKKTIKKFKKTTKNSKYSKSTKVSPSSGDGQKKWTTLSHNGVIFPPPYNPHGVKILYNGKPVDLTPAQEEVVSLSLDHAFLFLFLYFSFSYHNHYYFSLTGYLPCLFTFLLGCINVCSYEGHRVCAKTNI